MRDKVADKIMNGTRLMTYGAGGLGKYITEITTGIRTGCGRDDKIRVVLFIISVVDSVRAGTTSLFLVHCATSVTELYHCMLCVVCIGWLVLQGIC